MYRDILKEVQPSTVIYNPTNGKDNRETVLSELIPELKTGNWNECGLTCSSYFDNAGASSQPYFP